MSEDPNNATALANSGQSVGTEQPRTRYITLPTNRAGQLEAIKTTFLDVVGAAVFSVQMRKFLAGDATNSETAELFIEAIRESVKPRDVLEEMLVVQMAWTHARLARLSSIACDQDQRANVQVVHDACDRAANTFRRQMLALIEYRRPAQPGHFVAIKQANLANQQVVQNVENQNAITSNEQGSTPALPAVTERLDLSAVNGAAKQTVAAEHRPQDSGGQGPIQAERNKARRAQRTKPGGVAGIKRGAAGCKPT